MAAESGANIRGDLNITVDDDTNATAIRMAALRSGKIPGKDKLIAMWCTLMILVCLHCIVFTIFLVYKHSIKYHLSIRDWLLLFGCGGSFLYFYAVIVIYHTVANYRATKSLQKAVDLYETSDYPRRVFPFKCVAADTNKNISTSDDLPVAKECVIDVINP